MQLLIPPQIVNNQGWLKGYFETVGALDITAADFVTDYGFRNWRGQFVDEEGNELDYKPRWWTDYGLGNHLTVADHIHEALKQLHAEDDRGHLTT